MIDHYSAGAVFFTVAIRFPEFVQWDVTSLCSSITAGCLLPDIRVLV